MLTQKVPVINGTIPYTPESEIQRIPKKKSEIISYLAKNFPSEDYKKVFENIDLRFFYNFKYIYKIFLHKLFKKGFGEKNIYNERFS